MTPRGVREERDDVSDQDEVASIGKMDVEDKSAGVCSNRKAPRGIESRKRNKKRLVARKRVHFVVAK